jgi:hypothetical protein
MLAPPFWTVKRLASAPGQPSQSAVRFILTPPEASAARELDLVVTLGDAQCRRQGELYCRLPIFE